VRNFQASLAEEQAIGKWMYLLESHWFPHLTPLSCLMVTWSDNTIVPSFDPDHLVFACLRINANPRSY
jgi:hypothetical protein